MRRAPFRRDRTSAERERERAESREVLRLALPAFLALVAEPLFLLADSAIINHTAPHLAGLGVASAILLTAVNIFVFLAWDDRDRGPPPRGRLAGASVAAGIDGAWLAVSSGGDRCGRRASAAGRSVGLRRLAGRRACGDISAGVGDRHTVRASSRRDRGAARTPGHKTRSSSRVRLRPEHRPSIGSSMGCTGDRGGGVGHGHRPVPHSGRARRGAAAQARARRAAAAPGRSQGRPDGAAAVGPSLRAISS